MKILLHRQAEKYLRSLPARIALQILDRIGRIPEGDIRPLSGRKGEYRLRVGRYRILFYIEEDTVKVFKIDTRGDIYER